MSSQIDATVAAPFALPPLPKVINHTPWPAQNFLHVDPQGDVFHVLVCRTTYSLRGMQHDGGSLAQPVLLPPELQPGLVTEDEYAGALNASSTVQESDFAPYKPLCDVLVVKATAYAPGGQRVPRWNVGLRLGDALHKVLTVTGPRAMRPTFLGSGWQVDAAEPTTEVCLSYELAYGGPNVVQAHMSAPQAGAPQVEPGVESGVDPLPGFYAPNPIGTGRVGGRDTRQWIKQQCEQVSRSLRDGQGDPLPPELRALANVTAQGHYRAPQIEQLDRPFDGAQRDYPALGFGPIARWWGTRQALAGTHDEAWKAAQWPKSPLDHDYRYWNCAPEDQQIPYPQGGEEIALANLTPPLASRPGPVRFALPQQDMSLLARLRAGPLLLLPMAIDTVVIDLQAATLAVVRRVLVPSDLEVRQFELGTWSAHDPLARNALAMPAAQLASKAQR